MSTPSSAWQRWSLQGLDEAVHQGFQNSVALAPLRKPLLFLKQRIQPWVTHSYTQRYLPYLSVFFTFLLLFSLPFTKCLTRALMQRL